MFKNTLKRLGAIVLALAMAMSVMMVSAFAVDGGNGGDDEVSTQENAKIVKTLTKNANTYAPNATFEFEVTAAGKSSDTEYDNPGASAVSVASVSFAPASTDIGKTTLTADAAITVDASKFTVDGVPHPGVYYYTVSEKSGEVAGVTYDSSSTRTLAVYIGNDGRVLGYTFVNENGGTDSIKSDGFTNSYVNTSDLTITKNVTGNQGDKNKEFTFTIKVTGTESRYNVKKGDDVVATLDSTNGYTGTVTLKHGESVVVEGLSAADTYEVTEATYSDYNTTIENNGVAVDGSLTASGNMTASTVLTSAAKTVAYTNNKSVSTPTGVIMNIAPYVLMVALAGGIAFFFLRRRNAE